LRLAYYLRGMLIVAIVGNRANTESFTPG